MKPATKQQSSTEPVALRPIKPVSLGSKIIDDHHQLLFRMADELRQAILTGRDRAAISEVLDRLSAYLVLHLATEEMFMAQSQFPDLEVHCKEHDFTRRTLMDLDQQFRDGRDSAADDVVEFIRSWAEGHISNADRKLAKFLARRGKVAL